LAVHQLELRICSNRLRGVRWDDAELGLGMGEGGLDVETGLPAGLHPIERAHAGIGDAGCGRKSIGHGPPLIGEPDWRPAGGDLSKRLPCPANLTYGRTLRHLKRSALPHMASKKSLPASPGFDALKWRCIGPSRGGRVVAVSGDPVNKMVFYFGACAGGIWKTEDGGVFWRCVSDGFMGSSAVGSIAVAPSDPNVIYAGTGETAIRL